MTHDDGTRPMRWWPWVVLAVCLIVGGWFLALTLITPLAGHDSGAKVSAVQASFAVAFGLGGLVTLALFMRRQWLQEQDYRLRERIHAHDRSDAEARRITEQYVKAVEQLGHDKAPVRLGGLYALDRLGRDHIDQRRVIAEVWCAYLRRRFTPPRDLLMEQETSLENAGSAAANEGREEISNDESADEYEVRMTAQRLLISHLKVEPSEGDQDQGSSPSDYWELDHIDLTGATLMNADFSACALPRADFTRARFFGSTIFLQTQFQSVTLFRRARFYSGAMFAGAYFGHYAWFDNSEFKKLALFNEAIFRNEARFEECVFNDEAWFRACEFFDNSNFEVVEFKKIASFGGAEFYSNAFFAMSGFESEGKFNGANFYRKIDFSAVLVEGQAYLDMTGSNAAQIESEGEHHFLPEGWALEKTEIGWSFVRLTSDVINDEPPKLD